VKIAFFGDTTHPNAIGWIRDLVEMFDVAIHAVDYERPALGFSGVSQHRLDVALPAKLRYLGSRRALRRVLDAVQPDILLGYRVVSYGLAAAMSGFHPLVVAGQGQRIVSVESPPGTRWGARYALRRADLCLAWAEHMAQAMKHLGADPRRVRVLNRGVRTDRFLPGTDLERGPIAVTARQLAPYYRTDLIVEAFGRAVAGGAPGELWITGDGPERTRLEALAHERGLALRVRFFGRVTAEDLATLYRQASVYVSMVPTDGVSMSLLEAMSSGLIPIVVDNEPNRQWLDGRSDGRLVPAGDVAALASALVPVLAGELPSAMARAENRERIVARADRRSNLARMLGWWRELAEARP